MDREQKLLEKWHELSTDKQQSVARSLFPYPNRSVAILNEIGISSNF